MSPEHAEPELQSDGTFQSGAVEAVAVEEPSLDLQPVGQAAGLADHDLTFYDVNWYMEWTSGGDSDSCFEEDNGQGATIPTPARRNNLTGQVLEEEDRPDGSLTSSPANGAS